MFLFIEVKNPVCRFCATCCITPTNINHIRLLLVIFIFLSKTDSSTIGSFTYCNTVQYYIPSLSQSANSQFQCQVCLVCLLLVLKLFLDLRFWLQTKPVGSTDVYSCVAKQRIVTLIHPSKPQGTVLKNITFQDY